jgi:DNA replication protein DnaC
MKKNMSEFFTFIISKSNNSGDFNDYKTKSLDLQQERAELLHENGYPITYMDINYDCKLCKDEGFIGLDQCECYKREMSLEFLKQSNLAPILKDQTFENYNLSYFDKSKDSNGKSQHEYMKKIFDFCRGYAENFEKSQANLLFCGAPGCGKTYLSCAIGYELIKKGKFVFYAQAQEMVSDFEAEKFQKKEPDEDTDVYFDCDLLIIDDLGTEFQTAFSDTVLYNVINGRLNKKKPIIISTNYPIQELKGTYHDRLNSRLMYEFINMVFVNKDIRMVKLSSKKKE